MAAQHTKQHFAASDMVYQQASAPEAASAKSKSAARGQGVAKLTFAPAPAPALQPSAICWALKRFLHGKILGVGLSALLCAAGISLSSTAAAAAEPSATAEDKTISSIAVSSFESVATAADTAPAPDAAATDMVVVDEDVGELEEAKVDAKARAQIDPLAKEEPTLLQRLFSGSFNSANASDADTVASYQDTFFVPRLMSDVETLQEQASEGQANLVDAVPFKLTDEMLIATDEQEQVMLEQIHHGMSFVSYLLHMYSPQGATYEVPVFFVDASALEHVSRAYNIGHSATLVGSGQALSAESGKEQSQQNLSAEQKAEQRRLKREEHAKQVTLQLNNLSLAVDGVYGEAEQAKQGAATLDQEQGANTTATVTGPVECQGMTLIEADLKGKCKTQQKRYNGVILLSLPIAEVMREGIFSGIPMQVSPNVLHANYFAQGVDLGTRLVGFNSSYEPRTGIFTAPLHSFDKHLYSPTLQKFVSANLALSDIAKDCSQRKQNGECQLYFVGANVNNLLQTGNDRSDFNLKQKASLDVGTPYAAIKTQAFEQKQQARDQKEQTKEQEVQSTSAQETLDAAESSNLTAAAAENSASQTQNQDQDTSASGENSTAALALSSDMAADVAVQSQKAAENALSPDNTELEQSASGSKGSASLADVVSAEANVAAALTYEAKQQRERQKLVHSQHAGQSIEIRKGAQDLYGLPVTFSALGKPLLGLRNALLSDDQYKNYTFLIEAEMAVLSDLGYYMEPREFFGRSLYSFGSPQRRIMRTVNSDFSLYDHASEEYQKRKPSQTPLAIGVHLYGSYNDVVHSSNVLTAGSGSIGVRVDGSENFYYQTKNSSIVTSGDGSVGLGFTYGRDNRAYISGRISALGYQGIGIKVDMGSNIYSDLVEYRGSYLRVRTLDYLHGIASELEASKVPLLDELNGPQVSELTIDGNVEGSDAAIYIDESSFVKSINITSNARVSGGIYSTWNPRSTGSGDIVITHDGKRVLLDGVVQYPRDPNDGLTSNEFINRYLSTDVNLGVTLDEHNRVLYTDDSHRMPLGNNKSRVVLEGDLSSNTMKLRHIAGKSTILGNVRASSIDVFSGILNLCSPQDYATNQIGDLRVHNGAVLDLVNGKASNTYVQGAVTLGSNVTIRVDVDSKGQILDDISWNGAINVRNYQLSVEPGLSYNDIRRLSADPKAMLDFISNFVQKSNQKFAHAGITVRVPHYIWDSAGNYGREIRCNARGCRVGGFASNAVLNNNFTSFERWRYVVSFTGLALLVIGTSLFFRLPRYLAKRRAKKEQNQAS